MPAILTYDARASIDAGNLLRDVRDDAGLTQEYMARFTGWTIKQVKNWEAGRSPIKRAIVIAYVVASFDAA
jgi:transcriptional regulator with XRE-family HTH domain